MTSRLYAELGNNTSTGNLLVRESISGPGAPTVFVSGSPAGTPGTQGQIAIDTSTGIVWQNVGGGTTWTLAIPSANPVYGLGYDGALNFDGVNPVLGIAPAAGVYTLTRNIEATTIAIAASVRIAAAGFYMKGTTSIVGADNATSVVSNNGGDGGPGSTGGPGAPTGYLGGGSNGANGGATAGQAITTGAPGVTPGGAGGAGGGPFANGSAGTTPFTGGGAGGDNSGTNGAGGSIAFTTALYGSFSLEGLLNGSLPPLMGPPGTGDNAYSSRQWKWGSGGGGSVVGGGGGAGAVLLASPVLSTFTARAKGGKGLDFVTPGFARGGAGGGGGGLVVLIGRTLTGVVADVTGGAGGAGISGGGNGGAGASGRVFQVVI